MEISSNGPGGAVTALPLFQNSVDRRYGQVRGQTADREYGFCGHQRREGDR
jgi:hypothetical protein